MAASKRWSGENAVKVFMSKVEPDLNSGCWLWSGAVQTKGYGTCNLFGLRKATHVSVFIARGEKRKNWTNVLMHKCDTPLCVNPEHLVFGTQSENIRDMHRRGRSGPPPPVLRGELGPGAKLTLSQVEAIRQRRSSGEKLNSIAADYPVGKTNISMICRGNTWLSTKNTIEGPVRGKVTA